MSYNNVAEQWTTVPAQRDALFCDLADETPTELAGKLPCIRRYVPKTQLDILRALVQKMAAASWDGDRIARVYAGVYRWECKDWSGS
jgi:putative heme iron utilization protein